MPIPLEQALQGVDLQPGQTYRCTVHGYEVELRVLPQSEESSFGPDQLAPMEPWVALPGPKFIGTVQAHPAPLDPPFIPEIPPDEVES